jgi:hypothetical protein
VFFFEADGMEELAHHDQEKESLWRKLTGGKGADPYVLNTLLLTVAARMEPLARLRKKDALLLWERYREHDFNDQGVLNFIEQVVPFQMQSDLKRLWNTDLGPDARDSFDDDDVDQVLGYVYDNCVVSFKRPAH